MPRAVILKARDDGKDLESELPTGSKVLVGSLDIYVTLQLLHVITLYPKAPVLLMTAPVLALKKPP